MYHAYESCPSCSGSARPGTVALLQYLMLRFPTTFSMGIYNCRDSSGGGGLSIHSCGRAIDLGIPFLDDGATNTPLGNEVVRFLDEFAWQFGIMGQIWNRVRYDARTPAGRVYTGPHPHYDHNHIEQRLKQAKELRFDDYVRIAGEPIPIGETMLPITFGQETEDVRSLQYRLNEAYDSGLTEDAIYGAATAQAVRNSPMRGYTGDTSDAVTKGQRVNSRMWNGLAKDWLNKNLSVEGTPGPQGPKGDKGDTGARGVRGEKGDPGPAPTGVTFEYT